MWEEEALENAVTSLGEGREVGDRGRGRRPLLRGLVFGWTILSIESSQV
jgi:hypothetical protein